MKKSFKFLFLSLALIATIWSCGDDEETIIEATGIELSITEVTLKETMTAEISATLTPEDVTNTKIIWNTSDEAVAKYENGKIVAVAMGTANITAENSAGQKATCVVTVIPNVELTIIDKEGNPVESVTMKRNQQFQLDIKMEPEVPDEYGVFSIADESMVEIFLPEEGKTCHKLLAKWKGETTVTASWKGIEVSIPVTVEHCDATYAAVRIKEGQSLNLGSSVSAIPILAPAEATPDWTLEISNTNAVTHDTEEQMILFENQGECTLTWTIAGFDKIVRNIKVAKLPTDCKFSIENVEPKPGTDNEFVLHAGQTYDYDVLPIPEDANGYEIIYDVRPVWTGYNADICELNQENKKLIAKKAGTIDFKVSLTNSQIHYITITVEE